jgi:hypothetical protein
MTASDRKIAVILIAKRPEDLLFTSCGNLGIRVDVGGDEVTGGDPPSYTTIGRE